MKDISSETRVYCRWEKKVVAKGSKADKEGDELREKCEGPKAIGVYLCVCMCVGDKAVK